MSNNEEQAKALTRRGFLGSVAVTGAAALAGAALSSAPLLAQAVKCRSSRRPTRP